MPYWFERKGLRVGRERDRRRVLTDEQIEQIKFLKFVQNWSIRKLARKFKVDRGTIKWHLFPEFREKYYQRKKKVNWGYDREKHKIYAKRYREHLKEIYGLKVSKCQKINGG
jgi:hypothetical protein